MNPIIKFIVIVFCFLITILCKKPLNKLDLQLLRLGMFFTVMADLFMILLDYNTIGVALFCIVQITYIARYDIDRFGKIIKKLFIIFIIIFSIYIVLVFLNNNVDFLILLALFYSICICCSLYKSLRAMKEGRYPRSNGELIVLGMILFVLCDINVALYYMGIMEFLTSHLIWIFYLPSQFLLSISGYKFNFK